MTEKKEKIIQTIPQFVRKDYGKLATAFVLAFAITLYVYRQDVTNTYTIDDVPVHFILPPNLTYKTIEPPDFTTRITVLGKRSYWRTLSKEDIEIRKVISGRGKQTTGVEISAKDVVIKKIFMFFQPKVQAVSPAKFNLDLDEIITEKDQATVDPVYDKDELGSDYRLEEIICKTQKVSITGPSMLVREIREVKTEKIPLNGANKDFTTIVKLIAPSEEKVKLSVDQIVCDVKISERKPEDVSTSEIKDLSNIPIQLLSTSYSAPALKFTIQPQSVRVMFEGPAEIMKKITPKDIHPYVSVDELKEGKTQCEVRILTDMDREKLKIISIIPDKVTVTAVKKNPESKPVRETGK